MATKNLHTASFGFFTWTTLKSSFARLAVVCALTAGCALTTGLCVGDETPDTAAENAEADNPTLPIRILVTNADGDPVEGATITPVGMRTRIERGSYYSWVEDDHGKLPTLTTDENGIAETRVPKFVYEQREVGEIIWQVDEDNYVMFRDNRSVDDDPVAITLTRGRRIAVSAVSKEKVTSKLHAILSDSRSEDEWKLLDSGMLLSRAVERERATLRILQLPDDGPILFSGAVDLSEFGDEPRVLLKDVELRTGTRLEGTIDKQVPRPVRNGVVTIHVIAGMDREWSERNSWSDWTTINDDGTFVIDSLPRGEIVQMIVVCEGWVSSYPEQLDLEAVGMHEVDGGWQSTRVAPQVAVLKGDVITPQIKMEPTATCRIEVVDVDGEPITGAWVGMNPNQIWFGGGSQIVGEGSSMRARLSLTEAQRESISTSPDRRKRAIEFGIRSSATDRYQATTNTDGVAEISTLPGGSDQLSRLGTVEVLHDDYEQPIAEDDAIRRQTTVELIRSQTTEVTIRMDRKGTTVISD